MYHLGAEPGVSEVPANLPFDTGDVAIPYTTPDVFMTITKTFTPEKGRGDMVGWWESISWFGFPRWAWVLGGIGAGVLVMDQGHHRRGRR